MIKGLAPCPFSVSFVPVSCRMWNTNKNGIFFSCHSQGCNFSFFKGGNVRVTRSGGYLVNGHFLRLFGHFRQFHLVTLHHSHFKVLLRASAGGLSRRETVTTLLSMYWRILGVEKWVNQQDRTLTFLIFAAFFVKLLISLESLYSFPPCRH